MGVLERRYREETILNAAEKIFFSQGFPHTKMEDVAKAAGISKGSVYFYFNSKEDLYMAITYRAFQVLIHQYQEVLDQHMQSNGYQKVLAILQAFFDFNQHHYHYRQAISHHMDLIRDSQRDPNSPFLGEALQNSFFFQKTREIHTTPTRMVIRTINEGLRDGSISSHLDPQMIYVSIWSLVTGFEKLNISANKSDVTLYHVSVEDWWRYTLCIAKQILSGNIQD